MNVAIHWSGPVLVSGGLVLGLAIVLISFRPVVNQQLSPTVAALLLASATGSFVQTLRSE